MANKPTERQRLMRKVARQNMRRNGLESTLLGLQIIGSTAPVARAWNQQPSEFGPDDMVQCMRGVADELRRDPVFKARMEEAEKRRLDARRFGAA